MELVHYCLKTTGAYTEIVRYKPRIYYILIVNQISAFGADGG